MSVAGEYSEDALVEQPAIELFDSLGWETHNLYHEWSTGASGEGRETKSEVVLLPRLRAALEALNPDLPADALDQAIAELTQDRSRMMAEEANWEVYELLKSGHSAEVQTPDGQRKRVLVHYIDWNQPERNHFLLASQFWITGEMYTRRTDLIGFVNGIPFLLVELKAPSTIIKNAFDENLRDYRAHVPQLFTPNAFIMLSNGSDTKLGSTFAPWEHFFEWKRINDEGEKGVISLDTTIRGVCDKARFLDIIENFIAFQEAQGGLIKILAKNHQYLGVNRAITGVLNIRENQGRLGVFWHTQGSGKSFSMLFFSQKILRKVPGNWTFAVVTDRDELDGQIYRTFARCRAVTEPEENCHANSGDHLKQLLREDHRYVFTLIHKFYAPVGEDYPALSERHDVIVMTDEAHRTQYDRLALNMRNALPNAAFIGFTGTPLMAGEEKTREVFGDYVSIYNFRQSIEDGATVPLYYENRIPQLQLTNENLNEDLEALLEVAELDEDQERKVEREFAREYHLITRDERLDAVTKDIVTHFTSRGHRGKAMVICIDKATAVRMFDKVQVHWQRHLEEMRRHADGAPEEERSATRQTINEMARTDMAVVVSQGQNEVADLAEKGLDIVPHRRRIIEEDLDEKFKDGDDPLRVVFVCAMWITGFDVPSCSTIYLDKPMRNHTLMQTIARANRVAPGKAAGLIVDYVGVFRNLQQALAMFAAARDGEGDSPIKDKAELVALLRQAIDDLQDWLKKRSIALNAILAKQAFERIGAIDDAVEIVLVDEATKREFLHRAALVARIFKAILPDPSANELAAEAVLVAFIAKKIKSMMPAPDISEVMGELERLLDDAIATEGYRIPEGAEADPVIDLSKIDFEKLQERFAKGRKRTELERLRAAIQGKLNRMVRINRQRMDFVEKFTDLIEAYNSGSRNIEETYKALLELVGALDEEEKRCIREELTEEELALFDILTRPDPELSEAERKKVKKVCRALLEVLKAEKLALDWRKRQETRADVRTSIERALDEHLPKAYTPEIFERKCDRAFEHIYDNYAGSGQSVYEG